MEVFHFLLFLVALTGANSDRVYKKHVFVDKPMSWPDARTYCMKNNVNMSIIDTREEFNSFKGQTATIAGVRGWICLKKDPIQMKYIEWCDGTVLTFRVWTVEPVNAFQHCITVENMDWTDFYCDQTKSVFCYSEVILVEQMKTWDEALEYCRSHYTDLFSVTTPADQSLVETIQRNTTASSFWVGLRFLDGLWFWVNEEPLGIPMPPPCPKRPLFCGARKAGPNPWENRDCDEKMFFTCYRQGN